MGITAGENMGQKMGALSKEEWLWQAYGEGVRDALKEQPDRKFRMIHRFHMTGLDEVTAQWKDYPGPFDFSYKYAVAHMYGMTNPPFIKPLLSELSPNRRTWLTVRNDDIYSFRWGDPQFARDFIRTMPGPDKVVGFYMGPDGYCWGREAMDLEPESPRQLVVQKQWFSFMLWGRLSYDPTLPDGLFQRTIATRFPEVPAEELLAGWSAASRLVPETRGGPRSWPVPPASWAESWSGSSPRTPATRASSAWCVGPPNCRTPWCPSSRTSTVSSRHGSTLASITSSARSEPRYGRPAHRRPSAAWITTTSWPSHGSPGNTAPDTSCSCRRSGADPRSRMFYSRVKGEVEAAVRALGYPSVTIVRPSLLLGPRTEFRLGEALAKPLGPLMPRSRRPVHARAVAATMIRAALAEAPGARIIESRDIVD